MTGVVLNNLMDIVSFLINLIVLLFAQRKNKEEHRQLNERYQIHETYTIAQAMLPVYCLSTVLKVGIIVINWLYVTNSVPHTFSEVSYLCLSELSCGLTSTMFLYHHVRLRSKLCTIFGRSTGTSTAIDKIEEFTVDNHFQMLSVAWN